VETIFWKKKLIICRLAVGLVVGGGWWLVVGL
jgi:hypothetical protein